MRRLASGGGCGPPAESGWVVANLDAESSWARASAAARAARGEPAPRPGDSRLRLPPSLRRGLAALGTLMRVLARPGDRLWVPEPVEPARLGALPGLDAGVDVGPSGVGPSESRSMARVALSIVEGGQEPGAGPATLRWAEAPPGGGTLEGKGLERVAAESASPAAAPLQLPCHAPGGRRLVDLLWRSPRAPIGAALRANDRAFLLEELGAAACPLPGAFVARSLEALEEGLAGSPLLSAAGGAWILKAPFSASGRARTRGAGPELAAPARAWARTALELYGHLLVEPWMERTLDGGIAALLLDDEVVLLEPHITTVTGGGVFRAVEVASRPARGLEAPERDSLRETARGVGGRLHALGYRGPFGIDAWRYRDGEGGEAFHPLGELNARLTFGWLAHVLRERLLEAGALEAEGALELLVGAGPARASGGLEGPERQEGQEAQEGQGGRRWPLLMPSRRDPSWALARWLG